MLIVAIKIRGADPRKCGSEKLLTSILFENLIQDGNLYPLLILSFRDCLDPRSIAISIFIMQGNVGSQPKKSLKFEGF